MKRTLTDDEGEVGWNSETTAHFNIHISDWTRNIFLFRLQQQLPL